MQSETSSGVHEMKTAVITGAAGLFGSHMARRLLDENFQVLGIDNLQGGYADFIPKSTNFKFFKSDLNDVKTIDKIFDAHSPDVVYHFAAYAAEGLSPFIRRFNYENNVLASTTVINNSIRHNSKIVFTSSMGVYGNQAAPYLETMLPAPIDPYGIAKYAVELDLAAAHDQFGLKYTIVRPHNVVGVWQNVWDRYRNVLGIFIRNALAGGNLVVYGDGSQTRAFSDIQYYLDPLVSLSNTHDGEIFNIGADQEYSILEIAKLVKSEAENRGFAPAIEFAEPRYEVASAFCDHTKAKTLLDFSDNTNINELISKLFDWVSSQPAREVKNMSYEIEKNIYSYWK